MRMLSVGILVAGIIAMVALAGCGGGGGGGAAITNDPPPVSTDNVLTGKVISSKNGTALAGVSVSLGSPAVASAVSGADGKFALNIHSNTVLGLGLVTFRVDTSTAGAFYPTTWAVAINGVSCPQTAVQIPMAVITAQSKDMGTITATYINPDDPDNPPPPPPDDGGGGGGNGGGDPPPPPI